MEITKNDKGHGYCYTIAEDDFIINNKGDYTNEMLYYINLSVEGIMHLLTVGYDMGERQMTFISIDNQHELSQDQIRRCYMYVNMLEKELLGHIEYMLSC